MNENKEKKQLLIYVIIAYGVTFLMGLFIWFGNSRGMDVSVFPAAQMMYPAAGVMFAYLFTGEENLPKGYYITFLIVTGIMIALSFLSLFVPVELPMLGAMGLTFWSMISQYVLILGSIALWMPCLLQKKRRDGPGALDFLMERLLQSAQCYFLFYMWPERPLAA